jgi:GAF domain-containing protein
MVESSDDRTAGPSAGVEEVIDAFGALVDMLVVDFDLTKMLEQVADDAVRLLPVDSATIMLARGDAYEVAASTDDASRRLQALQLANNSGPGIDAARDSGPIAVTELATVQRSWPSFGAALASGGYSAVYALPLRRDAEAIGALNLFSSSTLPMTACNLQLAQALADIATMGVVQHGRAADAVLAGQLQEALNTRVVIEQAKGVIAEHAGLDMGAAFEAIRSYARGRQYKLSHVARSIIEHRIGPDEIVADSERS